MESEKKAIRRKTPEQTAIKERTRSTPKEAFKYETEVVEREIRPRTKQKTSPKQRAQRTIKNAGTRANEIRGVVGSPHKAKEVQSGTKKTIKTADKAVKNAERTAKATKKAAEASAKAAKRSEEAARQTAKVAVRVTKAAIKATIEGIKAAIAAAKELIAAAAAGLPVAIAIIIILALAAAIGGSCFGIPTDIFAWPLQENGYISSSYGYRYDPKTGEWKFHGGTDIAAPTGTPILASADGVVIAAQWHDSYGYYVKIQHNDTFATLYGHCSALHVSAGQQVK